MNKKIIAIGIVSLFVFGGMIATATEETNSASGPISKLFNRICDTLGHCRGLGVDIVNITGNLTYDGKNFYIDEAQLHFGPDWYITKSESAFDYDGDGTNETIFNELQGLIDVNITVGAHEQSEDWYSVFTINGTLYREVGKPIWAGLHTWRWRNNQP